MNPTRTRITYEARGRNVPAAEPVGGELLHDVRELEQPLLHGEEGLGVRVLGPPSHEVGHRVPVDRLLVHVTDPVVLYRVTLQQ